MTSAKIYHNFINNSSTVLFEYVVMIMSSGSQEIWEDVFEMDTAHGLRHCLEDLELFLTCFLDLHDGSQVVAAVAVIGSTPHSH